MPIRTLTADDYQPFIDHRKLNAKIRELQKQAKQLKQVCLDIFGKAKTLRTDHGSTLHLETRHVIPKEIPKPYSFPVIKEV